MRSPADMSVIQIDVTNACDKRCSNCTRFCGNHRKPFFMDYETFTRAVDSLDGFDGVTGMIGGEPTIHPGFEQLAGYIQKKFGPWDRSHRMDAPQREFIREIPRREFESHVLRQYPDGRRAFKAYGPGLWSNMGPSYRRHYELIQDTFGIQYLNDHINPSYHQPGLISRKDLGIPDDEWVRLRDECWMQNTWSATITPKGAFFCEVAGALDMLFNGPGGWKIEPGWWKRTPEEFGDQLHWCELCGFALHTFMRDAKDETDDVSATPYEKLKAVDSPKMASGHINRVVIQNGAIEESCKPHHEHQFRASQPYLDRYEDRFNECNTHLLVHRYDEALIPEGDDFGRRLNDALIGAQDWILLSTTADNDGKAQTDPLIERYILNPGTLHVGEGFALFHKNALSLRRFGYDRIAYTKSIREIADAWQPDKIVRFADIGAQAKAGMASVEPDKRYVIWGTGAAGSFFANEIRSAGGQLVFAVNAKASRQGQVFYGVTIRSPEYLAEHTEAYDYLMVCHYTQFDAIRARAVSLGVPEDRIVLPYEI